MPGMLRMCGILIGVAFAMGIMASANAQTKPPEDTTFKWQETPSLFLEPNRFTTVKDLDNRSLWLAMGFGRPFLRMWGTDVGLEGLAWSRLQALSGFRFPVETVDYFFGMFLTWGERNDGWRARIGHISSHVVDGTDSAVVGGSSSKYSREFVEIMRQNSWGRYDEFLWTIGLRGYFHQVTKFESSIAVPASLSWRFAGDLSSARSQAVIASSASPVGDSHHGFYLYLSSGSGPVGPSFAGGIRAERIAKALGTLDLQLYYQYGASWAGTDAGAKRSTVNLQMDVRGF